MSATLTAVLTVRGYDHPVAVSVTVSVAAGWVTGPVTATALARSAAKRRVSGQSSSCGAHVTGRRGRSLTGHGTGRRDGDEQGAGRLAGHGTRVGRRW